MPFENLHIHIDAGLKRRAEKAANELELRNLSAFVRMAIARLANEVLGPVEPVKLLTPPRRKQNDLN